MDKQAWDSNNALDLPSEEPIEKKLLQYAVKCALSHTPFLLSQIDCLAFELVPVSQQEI